MDGKKFYVMAKYDGVEVEWPTTNFTKQELEVVQRFLEELGAHAGHITIEAIVIMDEDD